jgi:hypothetical protein
MRNRFQIKIIKDEIGYITDVYISDTDKIIAEYRHPVWLNILEAQDLFEALEPIITKYRKWEKQYNKKRK